MNKQLYRSRENKRLAGVCGGIAEYFNIDPTIVRLVWVLFTITYGIGILAYIVAVIIIPEKKIDFSQGQNYHDSQSNNQDQNYNQNQSNTGSHQDWNSNEHKEKDKYDSFRGRIILGAAFVFIGILLLGSYFMPHWVGLRQLWPLILIAFGVLLLATGGTRK